MTLTPEAERLRRQILELEKLEVLLNEFRIEIDRRRLKCDPIECRDI
jgi:hypothetical protein